MLWNVTATPSCSVNGVYVQLSLFITFLCYIFLFLSLLLSMVLVSFFLPFFFVSQFLLFRYIYVSFLQHTFPTPVPFVSKCIVLPFPSNTHRIVLLCTILSSLNCYEIQQATLGWQVLVQVHRHTLVIE
jgi:hypothetical protein